MLGARVLQEEPPASAKDLRLEWVWCDWGTEGGQRDWRAWEGWAVGEDLCRGWNRRLGDGQESGLHTSGSGKQGSDEAPAGTWSLSFLTFFFSHSSHRCQRVWRWMWSCHFPAQKPSIEPCFLPDKWRSFLQGILGPWPSGLNLCPYQFHSLESSLIPRPALSLLHWLSLVS